MIQYLTVTDEKILPSQFIDLDKETKEMNYYPQIPIDSVFNQVKYLL